MNISEERQKALDAVFKKVEKKFGAGSAMYLGDKGIQEIESYSTGSLDLDNALGVGGFPKGRISEVYAQESVGKTTIALHAIADAQERGHQALFVDAEHALDPAYAKKLGVDLDSLIISQPESGEQALELLENFLASGAIDIVVIDSVAALVPQAELDGEMGDMQVGLQARLMSKALRKITGLANQMNTAVIFINQLRAKIGGFGHGPQTTTSGGNALKYAASVRIEMARIGSAKTGEVAIANNIKATVRKNKLAPPFKVAHFDIYFGEGIAPIQDVLKMGETMKIVRKSGAWYSYDGNQLGQGKEKSADYLRENPELYQEIRKAVIDAIRPQSLSENVGDVDSPAEKTDSVSNKTDELTDEELFNS